VIDIRLLRSDPDAVKAAIARRGEDTAGLDRAVELDAGQRALAEERDRLRNEVNTISREVGGLHRDGRADEAANLQARSRELGEQEEALAAEADVLADEIQEILLRVPNIPDDDCPNGAGEADNVSSATNTGMRMPTGTTSGSPTGRSVRNWASWTWHGAPNSPGPCS